MTLELLLLLLGGAIVSNVVLLVAASRSGALRDNRGGAPVHQVGRAVSMPVEQVRSRPAPVGAPIAMPHGPRAPRRAPVASPPPPVAEVGPQAPQPTTDVPPPVVAEAPPPVVAETPEQPETGPSKPAEPAETAPAASAPEALSPAVSRPAARSKGRRGRRFVLPPIEADHARTERVMLSLLSTEDPLGSSAEAGPPPARRLVDAWEQLVGPDRGETADRSAIVVALTIDGIERLDGFAGRGPAERIVTAVLDGLRRSARATDRVASVGRGHFRVLLVDADEAVAGGFVERVRAAVERRLLSAPVPLELVAGWAEAASVAHLEAAVHQAEERRRGAALGEGRDRRGRAPA